MHCARNRVTSHILCSRKHNTSTCSNSSNHSIDDRNGQISSGTTQRLAVTIDSSRKTVDELDDQVESGLNDLSRVLTNAFQESCNNSRRDIDDRPYIFTNSIQQPYNYSHSSICDPRNRLGYDT